MKVLFADSAHPSLKENLIRAGVHCEEPDWDRSIALANIHNYDGIVIRSRFKFDREMIDAALNAKFIARVGAGMENIDVAYAQQKGIACLSAPEGNRDAVAEHALGMLLALTNNLLKADAEVRQGKWIREPNRGWEISGKTIVIIGLGNNGSALARLLKGFNCRLLAYDPYLNKSSVDGVTLCSMDMVFEEADVVSLHVPLNEETHYLVNEQWLSRFRKNIWFINTARGKCVNTMALLDALDQGKVKGAALDVLEFEALSFENTETQSHVFQRLVQHPRVVLSPHIAGWTFESNEKMAQILSERILAIVFPESKGV
jgi:D-3-phosphoglycerate dehydrogenase